MSVDIKLGSLTIHLEDSNWMRGWVDNKKSNLIKLMNDEPEPKMDVTGKEESKKDEEEEKKEKKDVRVEEINLGRQLLHKVMHATKKVLSQDLVVEEKKILLNNYEDYIYIKKYNEENLIDISSEDIIIDSKELKSPKFISLHESNN